MKPIEAAGCCSPKETAADAARAMRHSGCGCAPVLEDANTRKLVGVVTERDVCCGVAADDKRASDVSVAEIMRPAIAACCAIDEPIEAVRKKLHDHKATSLPVVDKAGCCCGTISSHHLESA